MENNGEHICIAAVQGLNLVLFVLPVPVPIWVTSGKSAIQPLFKETLSKAENSQLSSVSSWIQIND